jgi:hypothetical protein
VLFVLLQGCLRGFCKVVYRVLCVEFQETLKKVARLST